MRALTLALDTQRNHAHYTAVLRNNIPTAAGTSSWRIARVLEAQE